ncbi:ATP-binding protein [Paenibacillus sp. 22594]|uniref:ATP-binding protein n=1 Tax=Paenibacillus sp. 22594 TaxID=3453947 RepID=UPI003F878A2E
MFSWQNTVFENLLREINRNTSVILLKGNSGVGKTYISKQIQDHLSNDKERQQVYFRGNDHYRFNDYYIFREKFDSYLSGNAITKSKLLNGGLREGVKAIPFAGDLVSWFFELISDKYTKKTTSLLDSQANEIMAVFQHLINNQVALIIFDDINSLDQSSIDLLKNLVSGNLNDKFTFLKKTSILLIVNTEIDSDFVNWLNSSNNYKEFQLPTASQDNIKDILEQFNYKFINNINFKTTEFIYNISGGNIELIKQMVLLLNDAEKSFEAFFEVDNINQEHVFYDILESRLKLIGADGELIDELLSTASLIGMNFNLHELEYITKINTDKIKEIIKSSNEAKLTENIKSTAYKFTHDIIRLIFNNRANHNKSGYSKKISQFLQFMKTGEYFMRANFLFEAGDTEDSLLLYMLGCFQQLRNDMEISEYIESRVRFLLENSSLSDYYVTMKEAYSLYKKQDFTKCINKLLEIEDAIQPILNMEKEYLLAIASKKVYSINTELNYSKERLEFIFNNSNMDEKELWARCSSCLMAFYYDCFHDDKKAFEINRKLFDYYSERKSFDPQGEYNTNILYRKSKMFLTSDIAVKNTEKSVEFFKNSSYLSQYYKSLCNHLGNLITLGEYNKSFEFIEENSNILSDYENLALMNNYYLVNNAVLSGVYSNKLDISNGIELLEKILESHLQSDDSYIIKNNLSVLLALSGEFIKAKCNLEEMAHDERIKVDDYYDYFISMNLASVLYILGEKMSALDILTEYEDKIPYICKNEKNFLVNRQRYLQELFSSDVSIDPNQFDTYLINKYPQILGPSWKHWGRGFLTSDIQFWSES